MTTAWQTSALESVPEVLVRFGKVRTAISVCVVETSTGYVVEARIGRKLVTRRKCGYDKASLPFAVGHILREAAAKMMEQI